jgi:hypothetical protein
MSKTKKEGKAMTEEMRLTIIDALYQYDQEGPNEISLIESFAEAGILTHNDGIVVTMDDGAEYQITIQRSR